MSVKKITTGNTWIIHVSFLLLNHHHHLFGSNSLFSGARSFTPKSFRPKAWALLTHLLVTAPTRIKCFIQREIAPSGRVEKSPLQIAWGQHSEDTPGRCVTWVQLFFTQPGSPSVCVKSLMNRLRNKGGSHLFMTFRPQFKNNFRMARGLNAFWQTKSPQL